ncbi:MAG: T9SS type A sorting domain-containing protein [Bacteroidales bacterium]|nr:T9SS type A sorting domain-containing protein [Bacteroidales bacterium]MCF8457605.1 T9SS type A sorting domain-containing protein [Bacteroidales bacterium]
MKTILLTLSSLLFFCALNAQPIEKPRGCFAGTNGTNADAMAHLESRGVLLTEKWSDIETSSGVFNFSGLQAKINTVKSAGLDYSLAIAAGAFGSPGWLIDNLGVEFLEFQYQSTARKLPIWWDISVQTRLGILIAELGSQFSQDTSLAIVYVSQMTTNGIEGHLNGVPFDSMMAHGFTNQKWIDAAKSTVYRFADAFPNLPIVFEIHEIDHSITVPSTILNELYADTTLCKRVGLGMWWISGKTSYQTNLINYISAFPGDKYAQVIGRSDQPERFKDSIYANAIIQAKELGIRYIEPWPYEFQYHTHDSLFQDFNVWADSSFLASDSCLFNVGTIPYFANTSPGVKVYPNPFEYQTTVETNDDTMWIDKLSLFTIYGEKVLSLNINNSKAIVNRENLSAGLYFLQIEFENGKIMVEKIMVR